MHNENISLQNIMKFFGMYTNLMDSRVIRI